MDHAAKTPRPAQEGAATAVSRPSLITLALLVAAFALTLVSVWTARNAAACQPDWLVNLTRLAKVATCLVVAAAFRTFLPNVARLYAACAGATLAYVGCYAADALMGAGMFGSTPAALAMALAGGVQDGLSLVLVTHMLIAYPPGLTAVAIPAAYLANEALYLLASTLDAACLTLARSVATLVAVALLGACLLRSRAFGRDPAMRDVQYGLADPAAAWGAPGDGQALRLLTGGRDWALVLAGTTLFPLVFGGVSQAMAADGLPGLYDWRFEVAALALLAALVLAARRRGASMTYPVVLGVSIPLFACGCALLPLLAQLGVTTFAAGLLVKWGYTFYQVVFWVLLTRRAHDDPRHAYLYFGVFYGTFELATLAARAAVHALEGALPAQTALAAFDVCLVMLWLLAMYGLVFFVLSRRDDAGHGPESQEAPKGGRGGLPVDTLGLALARAERDFGLNPRESEVVTELIHGYSMENIGRKLGITKDTVKTHARRIYRKLGVASKQELISMLERYPLD